MTPRAWNRYSYVLLACAILLVLVALALTGVLRELWLSLIGLWRGAGPAGLTEGLLRELWLTLIPLALVLLFAGWLVLHTGRSTAATPAEVRRLIATKQPVLLEFYSDY